MNRPLALLAALALAWSAGCSWRYQGEPLPQAALTLPVSTPIAATANLHYTYDGDPWNGPMAWDQVIREELEAGKLLGVKGLGRGLRIDVSRNVDTSVWRYVLHWLTAFLFPRSAELQLSVRATLLGPQDVELATRQVSSSIEAQASLLFLFFPPAWASWSTQGSGHEHPLVLENVRGLTRAALAALAADVAPRAQPPGLPVQPPEQPTAQPPEQPTAQPLERPGKPSGGFCTECGQGLEASWKHCPGCGTATRAKD